MKKIWWRILQGRLHPERREKVVIGADFNVHISEGTRDIEVMGWHGVTERKEEGQNLMVVEFGRENVCPGRRKRGE